MAKQGVRKLVGLGLCALIALVTIVVGGKLGLDVWQMEFLASRPGAAAEKLIGKPAPEFALKDLDGNEVTLDEFTGECWLSISGPPGAAPAASRCPPTPRCSPCTLPEDSQ